MGMTLYKTIKSVKYTAKQQKHTRLPQSKNNAYYIHIVAGNNKDIDMVLYNQELQSIGANFASEIDTIFNSDSINKIAIDDKILNIVTTINEIYNSESSIDKK